MVRASLVAERAGIKSVSLVQTGFTRQAKAVAIAGGLPSLAITEYPGVILTQTDDDLTKATLSVIDDVVKVLTDSASAATQETVPPEPRTRDIVYTGTLAEIQDHFAAQLWSDGLPIIPPTIPRVEEFLAHTKRKGSDVIGVVPPSNQSATIWGVAVNGVMAGCRPEYMPLLIAIAEAVADPWFHLEHAGSTGGWESLVILNGPIVKDLDFNYETGVARVGRRANSTVGRFLRLFLRNVAGFRPETHDKGSFGSNFKVVIPENEDAVKAIGWQPFSVDRGFRAGDSVVTVQASIGESGGIASSGTEAEAHAEILSEIIAGGVWAPWAWCGWFWGEMYPILVLSPSIAAAFARDKWSKDDLRRYISEHVKVSVQRQERYAAANSMTGYSVRGLVDQGLLPAEYAASDDPSRLVRAFPWPEKIEIVVSGDPNRNRSVGHAQHGRQGRPVSKKIDWPSK